MTTQAVLITLGNPNGLLHGGDVRVRSLRQALEANGVHIDELVVPQAPTGEASSGVMRLVGRVKRSLLPQPLLRPASRLLADLRERQGAGDFVLSTVPHVTYALARAGVPRVWGDFFDLPYRFARSEAPFRSGLSRLTSELQASALERVHRATAGRIVASYAGYGDAVAAFVSATTPPAWLPAAVQPPVPGEATTEPVEEGPRAGFLANFHYWPNRDAFDLLVGEWLPALSRTGVEVIVAGYGSEVLPPVSGIRIIGPVASLSDFYRRIDLALVPVRRGSGIKIKALEGLLWDKRVIVHEHVLDGFPPAVSDLLEPWGDSGPAPHRAVSSDEVVGVGMGVDRHPARRREEVSRMFSQDAVAEQVGALVERVLRM